MNKSLFSAILLSIFILFIVFDLTMATKLEFDVHLEPGKTFIHPVDLNEYAMGSTPVYIGIGMRNVSSDYLTGWAMGVTVYSVPPGVTVVWNDAGDGNALSGSIERLNHWEDDRNSTYWEGVNDIDGEWDGNLPDNFRHLCLEAFTCRGYCGMPPSDNTMLDRFRLHLTVPVAGSDPLTDVIQICLDYTPADWLFPDPEDFGGPYCFSFINYSNCGDVNLDAAVNILDIVYLINYKYKEGPVPGRLDLCDVNNDGAIDILDIVKMVNFEYKDGPELNCPPQVAAN